jgi:hypothetical protein
MIMGEDVLVLIGAGYPILLTFLNADSKKIEGLDMIVDNQ